MKRIVALAALVIALPVYARAQEFLAPILTVDVPGALGSEWRSELAIVNPSDLDITVFPFDGSCPVTCSFSFAVAPRTTLVNPPIERASLGEPPGRIIKVGDISNQVAFQLRVFDTTRTSIRLGTEIPVVPKAAFTKGPIELANVPVVGGYRHMLRIYSLDRSVPGAALVRVFEIASGADAGPDTLRTEFVLPLVSGPREQDPSYVQFPNLGSILPAGTSSALRLEISQTVEGAGGLWAFVSVTNDSTQEFYVVVPQTR